MWTWPLDSAIWVTTAHKASEGVVDGTCTQVWTWMTNKYRMRIEQKEIYNARDLPQEGGFFPGKRGTDSPSCSWWVRPYGNSYPWMGRSFPWIVRPSSFVFLAPTRSSITSEQTVAPSKPSSWTHFLQIHCNGSVGLRSHPSMDPVWKLRPYTRFHNKVEDNFLIGF